MIKVPSISIARMKWNVSAEQVAEVNTRLIDTQTKYHDKVNAFVKSLEFNKDGVIGLRSNFSFSQKEEAYVVHMMLVKHPNVLVSIKDDYAKYSYISSTAKYSLGMKALGLQFLTQDDTYEIRKNFKTSSNATFINVLLTINSLLGLESHDVHEFNIINLAISLAMPLDDVLISLSILKSADLIKTTDTNISYQYGFICSSMFSIIWNGDANMKKSKRNIFTVNTDFANVVSQKCNEAVDWLKEHSSIDHFQILPFSGLKAPMMAAIKLKLSNNPNIAFRPVDLENIKKVHYTYAYVDADLKNKGEFDTVSYRFIPHRISKQFLQDTKDFTDLKGNPITSLWILDYIYRYTSPDRPEFTIRGTNFKDILGIYDIQQALNALQDLVTLKYIKMKSLKQTDSQLSCTVEILNDYRIKKAQSINMDESSNEININESNPIDSLNFNESFDNEPENEILDNTEDNIVDNTQYEENYTDNENVISSAEAIEEITDEDAMKYYINDLINQISTLQQSNANLMLRVYQAKNTSLFKQVSDITTSHLLELKQNISEQLTVMRNIVKPTELNTFNQMYDKIMNEFITTNMTLITKINQLM